MLFFSTGRKHHAWVGAQAYKLMSEVLDAGVVQIDHMDRSQNHAANALS